MYRRPKFLELLLEIRKGMARTADYDVDRFAEMVRAGTIGDSNQPRSLTDNNGLDDRPHEAKSKNILRRPEKKS